MRKNFRAKSQERKDKHFEGRMKWLCLEEGSAQYREHIKKERIRLGLEQPT